jgi:hypothetical protein
MGSDPFLVIRRVFLEDMTEDFYFLFPEIKGKIHSGMVGPQQP